MKNKSPIYLNLFQFNFPLTAIVSILHRVSGFLLFILIPVFLYGLDLTLSGEDDYELLIGYFNDCTIIQLLLWVLLVVFFYHMIAGIRHLIMDFGKFESKLAAKVTGVIVILTSIVFAGWFGAYLWLVK